MTTKKDYKKITPTDRALVVGFLTNQFEAFTEWIRANGHVDNPEDKALQVVDDARYTLNYCDISDPN